MIIIGRTHRTLHEQNKFLVVKGILFEASELSVKRIFLRQKVYFFDNKNFLVAVQFSSCEKQNICLWDFLFIDGRRTPVKKR